MPLVLNGRPRRYAHLVRYGRHTFASTALASKASFNPSSTALTHRVVSFINGAGYRAVAVGLDRPASTVLR